MRQKEKYAVYRKAHANGCCLPALFAAALLCTLLFCPCAASANVKLVDRGQNIGIEATYQVRLKGQDPKAVYTYTSSDKKIAIVSKKGVVTGKKAGKAEIMVRQSLDQKVTVVGTLNICVKKAALPTGLDIGLGLGNQPGYYRSLYEENKPKYALDLKKDVLYRNPKAEYICRSCDESKLLLAADGAVIDTHGTGSVAVEVTEIYQGKARQVGVWDFISILNPRIYESKTTITMAKGESFPIEIYLQCSGRYLLQTSNVPEPDVASVSDASEQDYFVGDQEVITFQPVKGPRFNGRVYAVGAGMRYLHVYLYDYTQQKYNIPLGSYKINVKDLPEAEVIRMEFDRNPGKFREKYSAAEGLKMDANGREELGFYVSPYKYTGGYEVSSSDESVVKVMCATTRFVFGPEYEAGELFLAAYQPGTAIITLKAAGAETSFPVTVAPVDFYTNEKYDVYTFVEFDETGDKEYWDHIKVASSDPSIAILENDGIERRWIYEPFILEHEGVMISTTDEKETPFKYASFQIFTKNKTGKVTLTASYQGTVIYRKTIRVKKR